MKVKNKYNIGDVVWIGKSNPSCHRIKAIEVFVHPENGTMIFYALEGIPPETRPFPEDMCFLSKDECVTQVNYKMAKAIRVRSCKTIIRLCLILVAMIIIIPFCIAQATYWIFTGRKEPLTCQMMDKIKIMLYDGKA